MKLVIHNDDELSAAVAEHVARLPVREDVRMSALPGAKVICFSEEYGVCKEMPPFATSVDDVLPQLKKMPFDLTICYSDTCCIWTVRLHQRFTGKRGYVGEDETLARAMCIAALHASGHEVIIA